MQVHTRSKRALKVHPRRWVPRCAFGRECADTYGFPAAVSTRGPPILGLDARTEKQLPGVGAYLRSHRHLEDKEQRKQGSVQKGWC
jgi:hypothetical protein